jgi:hypothetical protein
MFKIDAAGKKVRVSIPCGCIYDPNDNTISLQGECQVSAAAWAVGPAEGREERLKVYRETTKLHSDFLK